MRVTLKVIRFPHLIEESKMTVRRLFAALTLAAAITGVVAAPAAAAAPTGSSVVATNQTCHDM